MKDKKYFFDLDFIRFLSCLAIFLYHLNILKGGYLIVCTFFVMTSYLSCIFLFKNDKINVFKYYKNRLIHVYIPFIIVVFTTICIVSFIDSVNWINLKPEATSVIFGYNNFWQLSANLDYFTRNVNSPFMHFWFMGILLQFELVFPFIFIILKKIGDKIGRLVPIIILFILCIISTYYFYYSSINFSKMYTYYNTFARIFSLLFGVLLGFIHYYYKNVIINKKIINRIIFYICILSLVFLSIFIDSNNQNFAFYMIITTIISCILIDYGTVILNKELNIIQSFISKLSRISYEIYLVQYPIIFLFQLIKIDLLYKNIIIILITFLISFIIHFSLNLNQNKRALRFIILIPLLLASLFGFYKYIVTKDYTKDLKELELSMIEQEKNMKNKQEEYERKIEEESANWDNIMNDFNKGEEELKKAIYKIPIVGVGDSVMLGATNKLYKMFPNGYFDAKVSRTDYEANKILIDMKNRGLLKDVVVIGLGTNGQCGEKCRKEILKTVGNRKLFWINVSNDYEVHVNNSLNSFANSHNNVYLIDWYTYSLGHKEYFVADKIHLTGKGTIAYSNLIYDSIYKVYLSEYRDKRDKVVEEHEKEMKKKISFYGNELLINSYNYLKDYPNANFYTKSSYKYDDLYKELEEKEKTNSLDHKLVFVFDNSFKINNKQYESIIELCKNHDIYIVLTNNIKLNNPKAKIIDFIDEYNNKKYLSFDKKHLSDDGNILLSNIIKRILNEKGD